MSTTDSIAVNTNAEKLTVEQDLTIRGATVLANAGEIATAIIAEIAGNDIGMAINGSKATADMIQHLLYQRIRMRLNEKRP